MNRLFGTFSFLRHGDSLPDHAELASTLQGCNHGNYSVLISLHEEDTGYDGTIPYPLSGGER